VVLSAGTETVFAIFDGRIRVSTDNGKSWQHATLVCPQVRSEMLAPDRASRVVSGPPPATRCMSATTWAHRGATGASRSAPEASPVYGIATRSSAVIVLTTQKGLLRSADSAAPGFRSKEHCRALEAGPWVRDPYDSLTLYAAFRWFLR